MTSCTYLLATILLLACQALEASPPERTAIEPFKVSVEDAILEDLTLRLDLTRWPGSAPGDHWDYGVPQDYLQELITYWQTGYNWRTWEEKLNGFNQFTTEIDGVRIHFIHQRSPNPEAKPLLLVHGWPGSVVEFYKIIGPLTEPEKFGGDPKDAFHVVAPSLPGFGFSGAPEEPGWSVGRMSATFAALMARLGYDRYGAQGGDWGGAVMRWLGAYDSEHVIGIHTNFPSASPPDRNNPWEGVPEAERERWELRREELAGQKAYSAIQGTRPQTLGYALNDSPAGLAAWIIDKFWAWSDHGGDLETSFSKDELLTNIMIYWVTNSAPSSARIYFERDPFTLDSSGAVPVGVALFPKEINVPPRHWIEHRYGEHLVHFTEMPRGGHFAALEEPELLTNDIRSFFRQIPSNP